MSRQIHLWQEETVQADDSISVSVRIENSNQVCERLWYRFPGQYSSLITDSCDPFVAATIFLAMRQSAELVVHGTVSPSLLQNLAEFQRAWACWYPQRYRQVEIVVEQERESEKAESNQAIAAFSGGVDSCFTAWSHRSSQSRRLQHNLQAGLMVHGFDIPLEQKQVFDAAAKNSKMLLASLGVELIPMATNFRELKQDWEDVHGVAIASCLMLLQRNYAVGLIGSFLPYQSLVLPWGTNPVTDGLLSSKAFQIVHDGAGFTRLQKIRELAKWPEALQYLRVCWEGSQLDRNCGRCEKCIRTILGFRVNGIDLPIAFEQDITDSQILELKGVRGAQLDELTLIMNAAKATHNSDSWVSTLDKCIIRNRRAAMLEKYEASLKGHIPVTLKTSLQQWRSQLLRSAK